MSVQAAKQEVPRQRQRSDSIGLAPLANMAFNGTDLTPVWQQLVKRVMTRPTDASALMDLATIKLLTGDPANGLALQAQALGLRRIYEQQFAESSDSAAGPRGLRLLALMVPGDLMANTPLEFMLQGTDVTLYQLYMSPGQALPREIPDHDLAIVAIGESDQNRAVLGEMDRLVRSWPRPILNLPRRIAALSRDALCSNLKSAAGIMVPATRRVERPQLDRIAGGGAPIGSVIEGVAFPIIVRPTDSHAGQGLLKIDDAGALQEYLAARPEAEFYVSQFVDYSGPDGLFRKYRIALIDGVPFVCHMAISGHWMVHYLNAGMSENAAKRAEEAAFMASFEAGFAERHRAAFRALADRVALEYFAVDCAESHDGRLLLFEADVAMIVHAMDPPALYPYKGPQMRKVFAAFHAMLRRAAG